MVLLVYSHKASSQVQYLLLFAKLNKLKLESRYINKHFRGVEMKILKLLIAALALSFFSLACAENTPESNTAETIAPEKQNTTPEKVDPEVAALQRGKEVYVTNCQKCHQADGTGGRITVNGDKINPSNLASDSHKKASDSKLQKEIEKGDPEDGMPSFAGKLSDQEMNDLILYIRKDLQKS